MFTFDPIAQQLGAGGAVACGITYLILKARPWLSELQVNSRDTKFCHMANPDIQKLRNLEISQSVFQSIEPHLIEQTDILREIRDGVRDLKP